LALLGIGEMTGGQIIGFIKDKTNTKLALVVQIIITVSGLAILLIFNHNNTFGPLAFLMCFLWGFQDSGANCLIRSMMGTEFDSKLIPFSVFNFT